MENNRIFIALGVLVLLLAATLVAYRRPTEDPADRIQDPWHAVDKTQITKITIQRPNNAPAIELKKHGEHWAMNQPAQGPADDPAVTAALDALSGMHVAAIAARDPANHAEMEVDPAHGTHVVLYRGTAVALDVWVGKNLDGGTAVRMTSGPTVYRIGQSIRFALTKEPREWRDRNVVPATRDHVRAVEWQNARGTFHFDRNGDTWTAAATNPPIERLDTARLNQTIVNLLGLHATDFAAPGATTGIVPDGPKVTITVDNGAPIVVRAGSNASEGELYAQREGSATVYTIGRTHGAEIDLDPAAIQAPLPASPDAGAAAHGDGGAAAPTGLPPGAMPMPGGMPMQLGGDGGIPPAVLQQLQRQMMMQRLQHPPQPH